VGRLTPSFSAIATFCSPATAPKIIRQRRATCCGVPWADSHCSSCVRSAASKLIAKLVFGMHAIIAIAVKSVKLFMIHYTSGPEKLLIRQWLGAVPAAARLSFRIHHNCADHFLFFEEPVCFGRLAERHVLGNVGAQSALL
jgi:hypothetical protein